MFRKPSSTTTWFAASVEQLTELVNAYDAVRILWQSIIQGTECSSSLANLAEALNVLEGFVTAAKWNYEALEEHREDMARKVRSRSE